MLKFKPNNKPSLLALIIIPCLISSCASSTDRLIGKDSNNNVIRDEVEYIINSQYGGEYGVAARNYAFSVGQILLFTQEPTQTKYDEVLLLSQSAIEKVNYTFTEDHGDYSANTLMHTIDLMIIDNQEREDAANLFANYHK